MLNNTKVENITDDNLMQYFVQRANCGVFKIIHGKTSKNFTNTIKNYVESTTVLPETNAVMDDVFNSTITRSTTEISESIFADNTASWTEMGIKLINNTIASLTNTASIQLTTLKQICLMRVITILH